MSRSRSLPGRHPLFTCLILTVMKLRTSRWRKITVSNPPYHHNDQVFMLERQSAYLRGPAVEAQEMSTIHATDLTGEDKKRARESGRKGSKGEQKPAYVLCSPEILPHQPNCPSPKRDDPLQITISPEASIPAHRLI